jgi:hypothetical protein
MTRRRRLTLLAGVVTLIVAGACASVPDKDRFTYVGPIDQNQTLAPDYATFKAGPDKYLGKRCGTLDCHGQLGRGMRLYSQTGLRAFDASNGGFFPNVSGFSNPNGSANGETEEETRANFASVVALEPEVMGAVIAAGGAMPERLLLFKKPLLMESHKGGKIMVDNSDPGYLCLMTWIAGASGVALNQGACDTAADFPALKPP